MTVPRSSNACSMRLVSRVVKSGERVKRLDAIDDEDQDAGMAWGAC
jgi:hypothetical protein